MSFEFNGISSNTFGIIVRNIEMSIYSGAKHHLVDMPGMAGSYLFPQKPKGKLIKVDCAIKSNTLTDLSEKAFEIAAWLHQTDWKKLVVPTVPGKYFMVVVKEPVDAQQIITTNLFTIEFETNSFAHGDMITANFVNDEAVVSNAGTYSAPVTIEALFTTSATEFKVTLGTEYIRVVHNFVESDLLKINTETGAVLINNMRAMNKLDWQNSRYFELTPGNNTLNITPTGKCSTTIKYIPRWLL